MLISETWLHSAGDEPKLKDLAPKCYSVHSFARDSLGVPGRGGGIVLVAKDSVMKGATFKQSPLHHPAFEAAVLSANINRTRLNIACVYRVPPSKKNKLTHSMFFDQFPDFLEHCDSLHGKTLFVGDFNIHVDDVKDCYARRLLTMFEMFSFCQSVTGPTQKRGHTLDLVFHRPDDNIFSSSHISNDLQSDHNAVLCKLNLPKPKTELYSFSFRCVSKIDNEAFNRDLCSMLSQNCSVSDYNATLQAILDRHAPVCRRTVPTTRKCNPWFSGIADQFRSLKRERRRAERRWLKSGLTVHKQLYESVKHKVIDLVHSAKTTYFSSMILASKTCKDLFRNLNSIMGKERTVSLPSDCNPENLPNIFSKFFSEKILNLRNSFPQSEEILQQSVISYPGSFLDSFTPVSESFVRDILKNTAPKSCELDPIPTKLLYENLDAVLPTITNIINSSLLSGIVPKDLKTAVVKPLLKKPSLDRNQLKNYRPVSNLPFISKLLEKVVLSQLLSHLNDNNLCNPLQSAYRAGHSTETVLLRVVNDILSALDEDRSSILLLLDNSAAFDTIDHKILLSRLENIFGVRSVALDWFRSYLEDRSQYVSVNGFSSPPSPLLFGVPQGSVLGPILFVLYTTPLSSVIRQHAVNHHLFADDTQLLQSCKPTEIATLTQTLQTCTVDIKTWMTRNKLKLNDDKTEALLFSGSVPSDCILPTSVAICSSSVSFSQKARNLGFMMDSDLSMKQHITRTCQTCYFELRRISSIRRFLTEEATKSLVTSCVLSRIDYCNALLTGCPDTTLQPLQKVQNSAARLIARSHRQQPCSPLLKKLHWLPVSERIKYKVACTCFSIITGSAPSYLSELVSLYSPSRTLRSSSDTRLLRQGRYKRKTHGYRSFSIYAPQFWNSLPLHIRHASSLAAFKSNLKTFLFQNHYCRNT